MQNITFKNTNTITLFDIHLYLYINIYKYIYLENCSTATTSHSYDGNCTLIQMTYFSKFFIEMM